VTLLEELRDSATKAFARGVLSPDRDASWKRVVDLGWLMIALPEAQGGLGLGPSAAAVILFEQGRTVSCAPLIPSLLGLQVVAACRRSDWIERICGGDYVPLNLLPANVEARADGTMSGEIGGVFEADMAGHIVAGLADRYLLIPLGAPGVSIAEHEIWDPSRRLFDVVLDGYVPDPSNILATGDAARSIHDHVSPMAQLAIAADSLGGANAVFDMTLDYLKMRKQFDRPLAMFQALKHRVADLKIGIAAAEALLWARAGQADATPAQMGAMKALATQTHAAVCEEAIQLHGGIGLTQEHPCHLFLKRAMLNRVLCGSEDYWEEVAGQTLVSSFQT
jgi:alkylation response protein AidB-like acyl-CoA dehydrogenase